MPGQPVKIGPFVGGMNTYSGPSAIGDNEAVELLNIDIDLDGSLSSRPGIAALAAAPPFTGEASTVIGTYRSNVGVVYIIYAFASAVYAYDTNGSAWVNIQGGDFTACVQYNDKLFLVMRPSGVTQGGGQWDPVGGYVAIASMPRGYSACVYKERMFIAASKNADQTSINRVKFSPVTNPAAAWVGTDFFDVAAGDGQDIVRLITFDGQIVVFKTDSTYIFAYESSPGKGQVQIVSATIGANTAQCVIEYENNLFVMHEANVYRISNWNWEQANIKIPFVYSNVGAVSTDKGTSVSILGNRLMCRYYDNYYVLGLKTGAWAIWKFNAVNFTPGNFVANPNVSPVFGVSQYFAGSFRAHVANTKAFNFYDKAQILTESFTIRLITKAYDFGPSYSFKRLFWWGVDLLATGNTTYKVSPLVYNVPVLWSQFIGVPMSNLLTWGRPFDVNIDVTDSANISNTTNIRTFIKLLKGLRFRQVTFTIESVVDSSLLPYRIFSLTALVDAKETVTKKVS